ncbi:unnamed protein product [Trichobilharzia regenti]|nr:unnamed protein product [Trichobilharzia regenti]
MLSKSLKKYFYEIIETIKQFNEDGGNPTKVTDAPNKDIIPVDGNATKTKLTIHENEAKRRRKCIEELRLRLQDIHQDKINLRNDLVILFV